VIDDAPKPASKLRAGAAGICIDRKITTTIDKIYFMKISL
jgi:hypothetical protein